MGGIGKTILAQALRADHVTQQAFPDGILTVIARNSSAVIAALHTKQNARKKA